MRFGWGVADQLVSSLTNFVIGLVAAKTLLPAQFGSFAIVFAVYTVVLSVSRTVSSDPLVIRFSACSPEGWRAATAKATGTALFVGVVSGACCGIIARLCIEPIGSGLFALAVTLPGLLLQDAWRFAFFAQKRGEKAFLNDLVWAFVLGLGLLFLRHAETSVQGLILLWGITGTVAGIVGLRQARVLPSPAAVFLWIKRHSDLTVLYLGEFAITTAVNQFTVFSVGALGGLAEAGALRGAQLLFGPLNVLFLGASLVAVPEGARLLRFSKTRTRALCLAYAATFAASALALGVIAWSLPVRFGMALLGQNWLPAHRLIIAFTVGSVAAAVYTAASIGLKAMAAARQSFRSRAMVAPFSFVAATTGAAYFAAYGAVWGMSLAGIVGAAVWWHNFSRTLRELPDTGAAQGSAQPATAVTDSFVGIV